MEEWSVESKTDALDRMARIYIDNVCIVSLQHHDCGDILWIDKKFLKENGIELKNAKYGIE